jgi:hypothetical protein
MARKQLDLFTAAPVKIKDPVYADFTIHEKINFKANECGLHDVFLGHWQYFQRYRYQAEKEMLTDSYWWHYRTNAGSHVRLDYYNQSKKTQLKIFK